MAGLRISKEDEYLLAKFNWRVHKAKGYVETLNGLKLSRMIMNPKNSEVVDHINGNKLDNTRENLRVCSQAENTYNNNRNRQNKTSNFKGVHKAGKQWVAQIQAKKVKYYLGRFDTPIAAAFAYDEMAEKVHGEFASLNFPFKDYL